jgi:ketosteroid isomerase-like protein
MSQENVDLFHKAVDAFARGDLDAYLEAAHPDCEWYPFSAQAEGGEAYLGHEGVRRGGPTWRAVWMSSRRASTSVGTWATP